MTMRRKRKAGPPTIDIVDLTTVVLVEFVERNQDILQKDSKGKVRYLELSFERQKKISDWLIDSLWAEIGPKNGRNDRG